MDDGTDAMSLETLPDQQCCFVCEDEGGVLLHDLCQCTNRSLHLECQRKLMLMTPSHAECCAVCKAPYRNVVVKTTRKLSRRGDAWCKPLIGCAWCALLILSTFQLVRGISGHGFEYIIVATAIYTFLAAILIIVLRFSALLFRNMPPLFVQQVHAVLTE